jgi:hypothetical protein
MFTIGMLKVLAGIALTIYCIKGFMWLFTALSGLVAGSILAVRGVRLNKQKSEA